MLAPIMIDALFAALLTAAAIIWIWAALSTKFGNGSGAEANAAISRMIRLSAIAGGFMALGALVHAAKYN